jgi:thymidylate synthase (FAD)
MNVELKEMYSTTCPDNAVITAARGDYMEESVVGKRADETLDDIDVEKADGDSLSEKRRGFIEKLMRRGHLGPFEHCTAFFAVEGISRACMAQLTRHRIGTSFDVQSMRYVNFDDAEMTVPSTANDVTVEQNSGEYTWGEDGDMAMGRHLSESVDLYKQLIAEGMPEEDARMVLPIGTKVNLTFSINARSLMHVLDMRKSGDCQWEIIELAEKLDDGFAEWAPITHEMYDKYLRGESKKAP